MRTPIEVCIDDLKKIAIDSKNPIEYQTIRDCAMVLRENLDLERHQIQKAFEDGVNEGMTDPERPFSGKEYYDMKFKK